MFVLNGFVDTIRKILRKRNYLSLTKNLRRHVLIGKFLQLSQLSAIPGETIEQIDLGGIRSRKAPNLDYAVLMFDTCPRRSPPMCKGCVVDQERDLYGCRGSTGCPST